MLSIRIYTKLVFKAASAALFGILLLSAFVVTAPMDGREYIGFYRYDYLLLYAVLIQLYLLYVKLETWAEAKVIALFHIMAMVLELVLTYPTIASWQYPEPAIFKIYTVPLFAGFMYSAVGSFFARCIKLFQLSFTHLPSFTNMLCLSVFSYINFMSKFFIYDFRYVLFLWSFLIFWKTQVYIKQDQIQWRVPMLLALMVFAFIIWIAENISTYYKIWLYPTQVEMWHLVSWTKLGSWYLLLLLSLVLVLKILGQRDQQGNWHLT